MSTATKLALVGVAGVLGIVIGCPFDLPPAPRQCWCGEQWRAQISGATAYGHDGDPLTIQASDTSHTRCVTMLEHLALNGADPEDPVYVALRDALESQAIANCELAGAALFPNDFDHTDCATAGTDPLTTNIVRIGACWEVEDVDGKAKNLCPLETTCGHFYDCSDEPIIAKHGWVEVEGETEGETEGKVPWYTEELLWGCDDPAGNIDGPGSVRF
jgi:hypothetical protein